MKKYILALDQGTTSSRAILFDKEQNIIATAQNTFTQIYPHPGWVEHDPMEIWATQNGVMHEVIAKAGISADEIDSIGITNQRETTLVWDKETGRPIYNAIVWQCRRTSDVASKIKDSELGTYIQEHTGLIVDAYFSATKIAWILDNVEGARLKAEQGKLMFGTIDTWLVYKLTEHKEHITDVTNESRTMLYNLKTLQWDTHILNELNIPQSMLPSVCDSSMIYGHTNIQGHAIPIASVVGDQQASLFGQTCFNKGDVKNTYGTGCFVLMNTKDKLVKSKHGLLSTIAIGLNGDVEYALEGSVFVGGAVIQWLRDELNIIDTSMDSEYFASKVSNNGGVYLVPAFTGLGAPHWDMGARGSIFGLTRGTNKNHLIRAGLESIAYQTYDVIDAMRKDSNIDIRQLRVDGGASANNFLMQFQSDVLNIEVNRPQTLETTALGACYLAGLATGFFESKEHIKEVQSLDKTFLPSLDEKLIESYLNKWTKAVSRSLDWED
ncbi:MAG: glycerol kinase GlpK [Erysipelothrix sp.]|nr:glycerol kinase GlpK [Erysipelothrix sp.]